MEKKLQYELYKKTKELIQNNVGENYGFERQENGKTVFLLIKNRDLVHLKKVSEYLKSLDVTEYPKKRIKHNHGGTEGTVLVSLSKITEPSIQKIEEAYTLMKKQKRERNKPIKSSPTVRQTKEVVVPQKEQELEVISIPVVKEETDKNVASSVKPQRKKRDASYGLRKHISRILDFEGYSLRKDVKIKPLDGYYNFCTNSEEVSNLILHASAWYCHNAKAVTAMEENGSFCVVVDLEDKKPAPKGWEKFGFCPPPKKGELIEKVYERIVRILCGDKSFGFQKGDSVVYLTFKNGKNLFLQMAMRDMNWNIKPSVDPFVTIIYTDMEDMASPSFEEQPEVKKEEMVAPVKPREDFIVVKEVNREMRRLFKDKEDAFAQLEAFIVSQEFKTLASELQIELRHLWKDLWIKKVKEDPEKFANLLLNYLKD